VTPPVLIPQTREQATQRDLAAGHNTSPRPTPETQLATLKQAIRAHRAEMEDAGPLGIASEFTDEQNQTLDRKHQADRTLWAHLDA
jgi:hypothetical protein